MRPENMRCTVPQKKLDLDIIFPRLNFLENFTVAHSMCMGTIYTDLRNNTINNSRFFTYMTIDEVLEHMTSRGELVVFWIFWIVFIGFAVCGFIYMDNYWLEDNHSYRKRKR